MTDKQLIQGYVDIIKRYPYDKKVFNNLNKKYAGIELVRKLSAYVDALMVGKDKVIDLKFYDTYIKSSPEYNDEWAAIDKLAENDYNNITCLLGGSNSPHLKTS